jgi:cell volume regulation protein A
MRVRDKLFVSWVGLRGAIPIVFAIYPLIAGIEKAEMIFNLVFFISITSVLIQGTTLPVVARWLKLTVPQKIKRKSILDLELTDTIKSELIEMNIPGNSRAVGKQIVKLGFPKGALIVLINRNGKFIQPNGSTIIEEGDHLLVLANNKDVLEEVNVTLETKPIGS